MSESPIADALSILLHMVTVLAEGNKPDPKDIELVRQIIHELKWGKAND